MVTKSSYIIVLLSNYLLTSVIGLQDAAIKSAVGDGPKNKIAITSSFVDETGSACSTCKFCDGVKFRALFEPQGSDCCIDCGTVGNTCNQFRVISTFETAWMMSLVSLTSSNGLASHDPGRVQIFGADDIDSEGSWVQLYDSENIFSDRNQEVTLLLNTNKSFKSHVIDFHVKPGSSEMKLGHYGIVQSYGKQYALDVMKSLTGIQVSATTGTVASMAPTPAPTEVPKPVVSDWEQCFNRARWCTVTTGLMTGLYRSSGHKLYNIEYAESKDPLVGTGGLDCYNHNWWGCLDPNHVWCKCNNGYFMTGLYRSGGESLSAIEEAKCCRPKGGSSNPWGTWGTCVIKNVWSSFDKTGWSRCDDGYYMAGLYKGGGNKLYYIEEFYCCKVKTS